MRQIRRGGRVENERETLLAISLLAIILNTKYRSLFIDKLHELNYLI